jgi:hypothetical protein
MNEEHISITESMEKIPTEAVLASSTLWPEIEKLYGHGYEVRANDQAPRKASPNHCSYTIAHDMRCVTKSQAAGNGLQSFVCRTRRCPDL